MIKVNKAVCLLCNDIIESKTAHEYVTCSCGKLSVDGGTEYLKRSFGNLNDWIELSESPITPIVEDVSFNCEWTVNGKPISILTVLSLFGMFVGVSIFTVFAVIKTLIDIFA